MLVLFLCCGLLLAGTTSTMTAKGADRRDFDHPYVQVLFMFIGESLCLFLAPFAGSNANRFDLTVFETGIPKWRFAIPAFLDFLGSTLIFLGIQRTTASQFQLMRSSLVPFTCAVSYFLLGRLPSKHELLGVLFVISGVALVSLVRDTGTGDHSSEDELVGNMLVVLAQFVLSFQLVWEEKIYRDQKVNTLTAVGIEGLFGMAFSCGAIAVLQLVPDKDRDFGTVESLHAAIVEIREDATLAALLVGNGVAVTLLNSFGLALMVVASAPMRTVVDTLRIVLIWAVSLLLGWEKTIAPVQIMSFILLVIGIGLYNRLISGPCLESSPDMVQEFGDSESRRVSNVDSEATPSSLAREPLLSNEQRRDAEDLDDFGT